MDQVTIWASLTEDTPRTVAAILTDPRTDDDTGQARAPAPGTAPRLAAVSHSGPGPIWRLKFREAQNFRRNDAVVGRDRAWWLTV